MCVHMYLATPCVCVCVHALQACSVWTPACFQYSLLLGGDYPAGIWLLSAFDWKLERPGAPWEERSENFLNPAFTPTSLNSSGPLNPSKKPSQAHTVFFFLQIMDNSSWRYLEGVMLQQPIIPHCPPLGNVHAAQISWVAFICICRIMGLSRINPWN